jgi:hypothetical protein
MIVQLNNFLKNIKMKKIAILSIAFVAITFASCKKERTCTCSTISNEPGSVSSEKTIVYKKISKKDAKAACMSLKVTPDGQSYTDTRTCTLK